MKRSCDYFITGTDTGVGKTIVTAALLTAMRSQGVDAVAMKPVQTGSRNGRSTDLEFSAKMAGWKIPSEERSELSPYCFPLAASPHLAARAAGTQIEPKKIGAAVRALRRRYDAVLVEGAGGVRVPLRDDYEQRDLIGALKLPVIVVARAGLGTLNHTLLTVDALRAARIKIAAVVLSNPAGARGAIIRDNEDFLRSSLGSIPLVAIGRLSKATMQTAGLKILTSIKR